jgi:hypothetical protein
MVDINHINVIGKKHDKQRKYCDPSSLFTKRHADTSDSK